MASHENDDAGLVGRDQAIEIARRACTPRPEGFTAHEALPAGRRIYFDVPSEPCWFIDVPRQGRRGAYPGVGGGWMIVVSRRTGRVLYDGPDGGA